MSRWIIGLGWWLLFGVLFSVTPRAVGQQLPPTPTTGPALSLMPSPTYPQTVIPKADRLPTAAALPAVNPPPAAQPTAPAERPTVTRILQGVPQPFVGQARPPIGFLRRPSAANTMAAMPPRPTFTGRSIGTSQPQVKQKPFSQVGYTPTISPYLQLDRDDADEPTPNYFTFVRPQLRQYEMNRRQQAELQRLGHQVQRVTRMETQGSTDQANPVTGHRTYFLNTGQFYSGFSKP